jgi:hypothetical protein
MRAQTHFQTLNISNPLAAIDIAEHLHFIYLSGSSHADSVKPEGQNRLCGRDEQNMRWIVTGSAWNVRHRQSYHDAR